MYTKLDLQYTVSKIPSLGIAILITIIIFFHILSKLLLLTWLRCSSPQMKDLSSHMR